MLCMKRLSFLLCALTYLWLGCPVRAQIAKSPANSLTRPTPTPTPATLSAQEYGAQLDKQIAELRQMENTPARPLSQWLKNRAQDQVVRRADGSTQKASGGEWDRRAIEIKGNARKEDVHAVRESLEQRRTALDDWTRRDASGRYFEGSDVQTRIRQLESSGVIRTGPSALQLWWDDVRKWFGDLIRNFFGWLSRSMPTAPSGSVPSIDPLWIQGLFYLILIALVGTIGYFLIRPLAIYLSLNWGGWGFFGRRASARRNVEFTGEDAELLQMPPDELLGRARAFAAQGNFREALRHIYIRLLLQLDARGVWHYDTRRTNWEHVAALRQNPAHSSLARPLSDLTRRFDRVRYGNAPCSDDEWQRFERDALAVETSLSPKS